MLHLHCLHNYIPQITHYSNIRCDICRTKISVIDEPEIQAAITRANRGFVDAVPTPISYEVFVTRLEKGNITREAFAGRLTDIPSMGLRFICATCRGPATFDARSKATTCVKAQKPCGLTTAEYTMMPKLEIHPTADGKQPTIFHSLHFCTSKSLIRDYVYNT